MKSKKLWVLLLACLFLAAVSSCSRSARDTILLGDSYAFGETWMEPDEAVAVELYGEACDRGAMKGCSRLGYMYEKGKGVTKDLAKAAELFGKACDDGIGLTKKHACMRKAGVSEQQRQDRLAEMKEREEERKRKEAEELARRDAKEAEEVARRDAEEREQAEKKERERAEKADERYLATLPSRPPACLDFKALSVEAQEADATGIPGPACDTSHPLGARILCAYPEFRAAYKVIDHYYWWNDANVTSEEPDLPEKSAWKSDCRDVRCVCRQLADTLAAACSALGCLTSYCCP